MKADLTLKAIDAATLATADKRGSNEHRTHLGGSIIGKKCARRIFYGWRWACREKFPPRLYRLFARGDREEAVFVELLRSIGATVWETDPVTGKQFRVSEIDGHFGGSLDGIIYGLPDLPPGTYALGEFKTHNDASFDKLVKQGLCDSKEEHFAQTQVYMHLRGLDFAVYFAVNKNDDTLEAEIVRRNPNEGARLVERAREVIYATELPRPISKLPTWFECKFCPAKDICHKGAAPEVNCRTCQFGQPVPGGNSERGGIWRCNKHNVEIDKARQLTGCTDYVKHPVFFPSA